MLFTWLLRLLCIIVAVNAWRSLRWHKHASAVDAEVAASLAVEAEAPQITSTPRISALIAAWNPGEDLERLVQSFLGLEYQEKELIIAVGGAHRIEDLQHLCGDDLRLIQHPGGGKQAALRRCLEEATGEIIFLTDADCVIEPEGFQHLIAPVVSGESSVTTGRHVPFIEQQTNPLVRLQWERSTYNFANVSKEPGVYGPNCCLTRAALRAAGDFAEDVKAGTDVHLSLRLHAAGYQVRFVQASQVQMHYHDRLAPYLRQQSRWLRNYVYDARLRGDAQRIRAWHRESLFTAGFLVLMALAPLRSRGLLLLLMPMLLRRYLASLRVQHFAWGIRHKPASLIQYLWPLAGLYVEALAQVIAFFDYLIPARRERW